MAEQNQVPEMELISRLVAGEYQLFNEVAERIHPQVLTFLHKKFPRNKALAEDAVQDALTEMYVVVIDRGWHKNAKAFRSQIFALAKYRMLDQLRHIRKWADALPNLVERERRRAAGRLRSRSPSDELSIRERHLARCAKWIDATRGNHEIMIVGLLSPKSIVAIASIPHGEIADLLGAKPATITRRWNLAKQQIEALFPPEEFQ